MRRTESVLGMGCAIALFCMMALTFCDVIARKLLGNSIVGATELTEIVMLLAIFLGLPLTSLRADHVAFDLLDAWLPPRWRYTQQAFANVACMVILLGAAWLVEQRALRTVEDGDHSPQLGIAIGPLHHLTALMLLLTALMHFYLLWRPSSERTHG